MPRTGIQHKRRRYVHQQEQDTSHTYVGGNAGANKGKKYSTGDNAMKKTVGYDALQGEKKERRGRGGSGTTVRHSKTTGQKAANRSRNRKNKAKGGK